MVSLLPAYGVGVHGASAASRIRTQSKPVRFKYYDHECTTRHNCSPTYPNQVRRLHGAVLRLIGRQHVRLAVRPRRIRNARRAPRRVLEHVTIQEQQGGVRLIQRARRQRALGREPFQERAHVVRAGRGGVSHAVESHVANDPPAIRFLRTSTRMPRPRDGMHALEETLPTLRASRTNEPSHNLWPSERRRVTDPSSEGSVAPAARQTRPIALSDGLPTAPGAESSETVLDRSSIVRRTRR